MKNKKNLIIGAAVIAFLIISLTWFFGWGGGKKNKQISSLKPKPTVSQIALAKNEEPKIDLDINSDRSGGTLTVSEIDQQFTQLEYELIYLAGDKDKKIERGIAGGPLSVSNGTVKESFIFGTESCTTGVCKRRVDKNVSGGTLTVRLIDSENKVWSTEKNFSIEKVSSGYQVVWNE